MQRFRKGDYVAQRRSDGDHYGIVVDVKTKRNLTYTIKENSGIVGDWYGLSWEKCSKMEVVLDKMERGCWNDNTTQKKTII